LVFLVINSGRVLVNEVLVPLTCRVIRSDVRLKVKSCGPRKGTDLYPLWIPGLSKVPTTVFLRPTIEVAMVYDWRYRNPDRTIRFNHLVGRYTRVIAMGHKHRFLENGVSQSVYKDRKTIEPELFDVQVALRINGPWIFIDCEKILFLVDLNLFLELGEQ
jgi:hypothetical protein